MWKFWEQSAPDSPYTVEHYFPPDPKLPYGSFLVLVTQSQQTLRIHTQFLPNDVLTQTLCHNIPILTQLGDLAPTVTQSLCSGNPTLTSADWGDMPTLNLKTLASQNKTWVNLIWPWLQQVAPGLYFVTCNRYYPTDGQGRLFWGSYEQPANSWAMNYHWDTLEPNPTFLLASQGAVQFNPDRYAEAQSQFQHEPGLCYYLGGYLSLLLVGHHRALAAAEAGEPFWCITIAKAPWHSYCGDMYPLVPHDVALLFDKSIASRQLSKQTHAWWTQQVQQSWTPPIPVTPAPTWTPAPIPDTFTQMAERIAPNVSQYPDLAYIDAAQQSHHVSETVIEDAFISSYGDLPLETILEHFITCRDDRTRMLAFRIVNDARWQDLWPKALAFLSRYRDTEVADLFMDLAIRVNRPSEQVMTVVDHYLASHLDLFQEVEGASS